MIHTGRGSGRCSPFTIQTIDLLHTGLTKLSTLGDLLLQVPFEQFQILPIPAWRLIQLDQVFEVIAQEFVLQCLTIQLNRLLLVLLVDGQRSGIGHVHLARLEARQQEVGVELVQYLGDKQIGQRWGMVEVMRWILCVGMRGCGR